MTNEEFGEWIVALSHIARVRKAILNSARSPGGLCKAEWGVVCAIKRKPEKSKADTEFLEALEKVCWQGQLKDLTSQ